MKYILPGSGKHNYSKATLVDIGKTTFNELQHHDPDIGAPLSAPRRIFIFDGRNCVIETLKDPSIDDLCVTVISDSESLVHKIEFIYI